MATETIPPYFTDPWILCFACREPYSAHVDRKCPFEASTFSPDDEKLLALILEEAKILFENFSLYSSDSHSALAGTPPPLRERRFFYVMAADRVLGQLLNERTSD